MLEECGCCDIVGLERDIKESTNYMRNFLTPSPFSLFPNVNDALSMESASLCVGFLSTSWPVSGEICAILRSIPLHVKAWFILFVEIFLQYAYSMARYSQIYYNWTHSLYRSYFSRTETFTVLRDSTMFKDSTTLLLQEEAATLDRPALTRRVRISQRSERRLVYCITSWCRVLLE